MSYSAGVNFVEISFTEKLFVVEFMPLPTWMEKII